VEARLVDRDFEGAGDVGRAHPTGGAELVEDAGKCAPSIAQPNVRNIWCAAAVFGVLGALVAPWIIERFATGRLTVAAAWSFAPLVVPMIFFNNPVVVAGALGTGLLPNPAGNAGIGAYRLAITPDGLQGRNPVDDPIPGAVLDAADPDLEPERPLGSPAGGLAHRDPQGHCPTRRRLTRQAPAATVRRTSP
jgi:hypothetical protein